MKYNRHIDRFADKFRVDSSRLKGWDYSTPGIYFITICTYNHNKFLGQIENRKIILSEAGKIAKKYWQEIPSHFSNIVLGEYVIMPNHIHGILELKCSIKDFCRDVACNVSTTENNRFSMISPKCNSVSVIVRSYKSVVTKYANDNNLYFSWQTRFYDHIIKNDQELIVIKKYIKNNPVNWQKDRFFIK